MSKAALRAFVRPFEEHAIEPSCFDHRMHIQMAWSYQALYSQHEALYRFVNGLTAFIEKAGAQDKYHQTITFALFFYIGQRRAELAPGHTFEDFEAANRILFEDAPDLLRRRYNHSPLLNQPLAKQVFVLP